MFKQIIADFLPEWVEQKFHAFAACEFGSGNKVTVAGYEDYGVNLLLKGHGADVQSNAHVDALLPQRHANFLFM